MPQSVSTGAKASSLGFGAEPAKKSPFPPVGASKANAAAADFAVELSDEDEEDDWGLGDDDNWGEVKPSTKGLENFDYKNEDLNKLSDWELKRHKANMDKDFNKKQVKQDDEGFEYDKRINYDRNAAAFAGADEADSWDEDEDEEEAGGDDDDDYFDDDFA